MSAPMPDLKPHVPPLAPGSECCGCCDGIAAETPQGLDNRDGLSAIAYRIGDYARFRASLHAALSSSAFQPLSLLHTRDDANCLRAERAGEDGPGVAVERESVRLHAPGHDHFAQSPSGLREHPLAFGVGIHGCVGQNIARAEGEAILRALAQRVTRL